MNPLSTSRVVLAVSGGIAAYKAAELASGLVQSGAIVDIVLTRGAVEFIQPLTFQALTKRPVHDDVFEPWSAFSSGHVSLAAEADLVIVAPASANTIARLALGLADDFLGVLALSTRAPLLIAPAMEHHMFHHPATQRHLETLRTWGTEIVGPASGRLASGASGNGRLAPPGEILGAARQLLGRSGPLARRKIVITAGGTREPLDPVRFLSNGSSGTMGFALAQAALDHGADVTLIHTIADKASPYGATVVTVETALEMAAAVTSATGDADAVIMAAAVADFRPLEMSPRKMKKTAPELAPAIRMTPNPDILASIKRPELLKIGFAAETEDLVANALAKLRSKDLALIVANDAAATIGQAQSRATLISPDRQPEALPLLDKSDLAEVIIKRVIELLGGPAS